MKICKNFYQNLLDLNLTIILQIRCNKTGGVCRILASPLLFGSPCGNSTHVLEVNYICINPGGHGAFREFAELIIQNKK